jgi:hypothetical protein
MWRFAVIAVAATLALALFLLQAVSTAASPSYILAAAAPQRVLNATAERREVVVVHTGTVNLTELFLNGTARPGWLKNISNPPSTEYCPLQTAACPQLLNMTAYDVHYNSVSLNASGGGSQPAAAVRAALSWHLALGAAGAALYGYGLYLSACSGPLCRWRRFKAVMPLSVATVLISAALSAASPFYLALAAPGVWGVAHYYKARRRLALWLSSTLT